VTTAECDDDSELLEVAVAATASTAGEADREADVCLCLFLVDAWCSDFGSAAGSRATPPPPLLHALLASCAAGEALPWFDLGLAVIPIFAVVEYATG